MEIIFIRHAEKKEGNNDDGLSSRGVIQARNLALFLTKEKFDEFYCSDMRRAIETAKIVSEKLKLKIKIESCLNEFNSNIFKLSKNKWEKDDIIRFSKLKLFLKNFTKRAEEDKRILIISHGNTNRLIMALLLEIGIKNIIRFRLLETGISEVYWASKFKNWRLKYWNKTSHQPIELIEGEDKY